MLVEFEETIQSRALRGEADIDPRSQDFFRAVVEERKRAEAREGKESWRAKGLKVLANATSYGIYAQMTRHELAPDRREHVTVYERADDPHSYPTSAPEDPGDRTEARLGRRAEFPKVAKDGRASRRRAPEPQPGPFF